MARRFWTCPKGCGGRWERSLVKCRTEGYPATGEDAERDEREARERLTESEGTEA